MEPVVTNKPRPPTELLQYSTIPKVNSFSHFKLSAPQRRMVAASIYAENRKVNSTVERLKTKESKFGRALREHSNADKLFSSQLSGWLVSSRQNKSDAIRRENTRINLMLKHVKSDYSALRN